MTAALRNDDPARLGGYELVGRLGEGGQGTVFLGRSGGDEVAIKLLNDGPSGDEMARMRFVREVEVAKRVASFCTAQVLDAGVENGRPYIVSEYVPGPSLYAKVAEDGPLTGGALQRTAVGIATALVAIHQAGVVHRDLKPGNVLLGPAGARVIDFGIARALDAATLTGRMVGTPVYMPPEQLRAEPAAPPMDVFAWAATIVFAATGRPPFGNDTLAVVVNRILNGEPDLGSLDGPLREVVQRCLVKDPHQRPEAHEVLLWLLGRTDAPQAVAAAAPAPAHETFTTGMLEAGQDLAGQHTPEPAMAQAPAPPPPAMPRTVPPWNAVAAHQQGPGHQATIAPRRPPVKGRGAAMWAAGLVVLATLLTGLILLLPQLTKGGGKTDPTPSPQTTQPSTPSSTPSPTDTSGGYGY